MSIIANELVWRKPAEVSDAGSNGGRMAFASINSAVKNNIFPDVPQSERTAGSTKYRKIFIHVANDADLALVAPKVFVETRTPGDDNVTFIAGTQRDTQSAITGSETKFGAGVLNANVSGGTNTITVLVEDAANDIFPNGSTIRISDKTSINGAVKNAGVGQFGSGWAWLTFGDGRLQVEATGNAGTPMATGKHCLLTLDVWEHAYYLDYQNRRPDYLDALIKERLDWSRASGRFDAAAG